MICESSDMSYVSSDVTCLRLCCDLYFGYLEVNTQCFSSYYLQDVAEFYGYWSSYCTSMDFHWADEYDIREAQRIGRWAEKVGTAIYTTIIWMIKLFNIILYCKQNCQLFNSLESDDYRAGKVSREGNCGIRRQEGLSRD